MTELKSMMNMMDPSHSIILFNELGLMGNSEYIVDGSLKILEIKNAYNIKTNTKRGEYFNVIDSDGTLLFNEYISRVGYILDKDNIENVLGYIFILKDYMALNPMDIIFNDSGNDPAIIIYLNGVFYINYIKELIDNTKFRYTKGINIHIIDDSLFVVTFLNMKLTAHLKDRNNGIFEVIQRDRYTI